MDVATGAIGSLIPKLRELLKEKYKLQTGVKEDVQFLESELQRLQDGLRNMADKPMDQLDKQGRNWANDVRETSYRMEDEVDALLMRVDGSELAGNSGSFLSTFEKKMSNLCLKDKTRHQIRDLKGQVLQVANRRPEMNKIDRVIADQATTTTTDPCMVAALSKKELVGINKERDDLIKRLTDVSKKQPNVLSIFGFGGLGKTTLANAVYEKLEASFDCRAFISVGRNPDVKKVFKDILSQINKGKCTTLDEMDQLIREVRALLEHKRYFIIIDDIWDKKSWEMIRDALVDKNLGSRIILTTRNLEVAVKAGDVYKLQPLSHDDSKKLLNTSFKGSRGQMADVTEKFLEKCGGVPLAILTIASLLAKRPMKDLSNVYESLGSGHADDQYVEIMRKTLLSSYYDLPHHLRTCLLHLSIFPANHMIRKDTLIWKWIAEGFIRAKPKVGLFELGEGYFSDLINRSMIQPVEIPYSGIVTGCQIHGMVLDMICSLSREVNFVTLLDSNKQHTFSLGNARRLAIQSTVDPLPGKDMERVRSFNAIRCPIGRMPSLKVLRVLAIEDCTFVEGCSNSCLEHIGRLVQLRYLGLRNTPVRELPEEVGKLRFMETLDLRQTSIQELPRSVGLLRRLRCLRANGGPIRVPDWTEMLTSLEELSLNDVDVTESPDFVTALGKLTELRELSIQQIRSLEARSKKDLVESLSRLQKIQVLQLECGSWSEEAGWGAYVPSLQLRQLSLSIKFSRLPAWISSSLLPKLSHLSVHVEAPDLEILGMFPELISLTMFVPMVALDITAGGGGAFPKLRHFYTSGMPRFGVGAMPSLESVNFKVLQSPVDLKFDSLINLPSLENVRVEISGPGAIEAKKALKLAVDEHPNRPTLFVGKDCSATAQAS